jgi:hypothetical protein
MPLPPLAVLVAAMRVTFVCSVTGPSRGARLVLLNCAELATRAVAHAGL